MYIKIGDKKYPCTGFSPGKESVMFSGVSNLDTAPTSGTVGLYSDDDFEMCEMNVADYARQTYADGVLTMTNEPQPSAPTVDELRAAALQRISGKCKEAIMSGITVDSKHYTLDEFDQLSLNAAWNRANEGETQISFAADNEALSAYTAAQIQAIGKAAYNWGLTNRLYNAMLQVWIARETDTTVLPSIHYGKTLPTDLSEALAKQLTAAGIDTVALSGLLTA